LVYAVEFSHRSGRDLVNLAKKRTNIIPIVEDARHPQKYRMLVGMVDVVFSDVAQPDQARIVALNSQYFLKTGGHFVISIKANCIDSVAAPEAVFAREVAKLKEDGFKPKEQLTLEPYERDHAVVCSVVLCNTCCLLCIDMDRYLLALLLVVVVVVVVGDQRRLLVSTEQLRVNRDDHVLNNSLNATRR
jgi:hypothetical protein